MISFVILCWLPGIKTFIKHITVSRKLDEMSMDIEFLYNTVIFAIRSLRFFRFKLHREVKLVRKWSEWCSKVDIIRV